MTRKSQRQRITCTFTENDFEKVSCLCNKHRKNMFQRLDAALVGYRYTKHKQKILVKRKIEETRDVFKKDIDVKNNCLGFRKVCDALFFLVRVGVLTENIMIKCIKVTLEKLKRMYEEKTMVFSL